MASARVVILAAALLSAAAASARAQAPASARPHVVVAELDGIIHPIASEYLSELITQGDTSGADAVIVILRTPGGLLESTRAIVSRIITSRAPVVVFVGPSGARAASAGFVITLAADVAVMAPGTHIGAAHPVSGSGQPVDETMAKKAASDTAAYVRSLAEARGRNVALAADAVLESRAFTEREALQAVPPLIDFTAQNLDDLLRQLDGRLVRRFDGRTVTLRTAGADIARVDMSWRQRFLSALAHPQIAYLLLTLGALGLTIELWSPGAIAPGVVGGLSLLLAFFALQILPVNTSGLLLVLFGLGLLILELKVPSFGILGVGGTVSLLVGSIIMTREVPGVTVSLAVIVPVVLAVAGIVLLLGRLALVSQGRRPATGADGLIGEEGRSRAPLAPDTPGQIDVHGEIWRGLSREPIPAGAKLRVVAIDGLTLLVEPVGTGSARPASGAQGEDEWKA